MLSPETCIPRCNFSHARSISSPLWAHANDPNAAAMAMPAANVSVFRLPPIRCDLANGGFDPGDCVTDSKKLPRHNRCFSHPDQHHLPGDPTNISTIDPPLSRSQTGNSVNRNPHWFWFTLQRRTAAIIWVVLVQQASATNPSLRQTVPADPVLGARAEFGHEFALSSESEQTIGGVHRQGPHQCRACMQRFGKRKVPSGTTAAIARHKANASSISAL